MADEGPQARLFTHWAAAEAEAAAKAKSMGPVGAVRSIGPIDGLRGLMGHACKDSGNRRLRLRP